MSSPIFLEFYSKVSEFPAFFHFVIGIIMVCFFWQLKSIFSPFSPENRNQVLNKVLLAGAAGPVEVFLTTDEVDDGSEAWAADDAQVHGQVKVVSHQE